MRSGKRFFLTVNSCIVFRVPKAKGLTRAMDLNFLNVNFGQRTGFKVLLNSVMLAIDHLKVQWLGGKIMPEGHTYTVTDTHVKCSSLQFYREVVIHIILHMIIQEYITTTPVVHCQSSWQRRNISIKKNIRKSITNRFTEMVTSASLPLGEWCGVVHCFKTHSHLFPRPGELTKLPNVLPQVLINRPTSEGWVGMNFQVTYDLPAEPNLHK